ncbi:MAG: TetR/AcrR family transcriptional regulator [Gemmatimonadetes bacterium]|nr:TetR/AcrR family transcriptional regulator [Gemmatimonadota bacterium]
MTKSAAPYHHGSLKDALVDEAAAMIAEGGVDGVTMRAIGERLGVSRAAPYRHFPDKTALIVAVAATGFARLSHRLRSVDAEAAGASLGRIRRMGEEYIRFAIENPAHYRVMYGKEALARREQPELRQAGDAIFDHLVDVLRAHQRSGGIKRQDPRVQAYVAWSAAHGLASLLIEEQILADVDVDAVIGQTTNALLNGLRRRARR